MDKIAKEILRLSRQLTAAPLQYDIERNDPLLEEVYDLVRRMKVPEVSQWGVWAEGLEIYVLPDSSYYNDAAFNENYDALDNMFKVGEALGKALNKKHSDMMFEVSEPNQDSGIYISVYKTGKARKEERESVQIDKRELKEIENQFKARFLHDGYIGDNTRALIDLATRAGGINPKVVKALSARARKKISTLKKKHDAWKKRIAAARKKREDMIWNPATKRSISVESAKMEMGALKHQMQDLRAHIKAAK